MSLLRAFERFGDHLPLALLLVTPEGRVDAANATARQRLRCPAGDWSLLERAADPDALRRYLTLCSGSGERLPGGLELVGTPVEGPLRCDCSALPPEADGTTRHLLLSLRARPEAAQRFALLNDQIERLHREIRRREEAERDLETALAQERRAREEAEEANRLKDEFLATVSHELRTPLHAIRGWVHVLRHQTPARTTLDRALDVIDRNTDLQSQLVEDVLDVSQIITGRLRLSLGPVDLYSVVYDSVETVRPAAEAKNIRLQVVAEGGDTVVQGDYQRLVQTVWNLLSNAIKFTPKGGRVQVLLKRVNSHVEIVVSDDGEGIPRDFLPFVFDRFRQADGSITRHHGGLGLGLSIVRHLVEVHGGLVFAESEGEGRGATFTVSLPVPLVGPAATEVAKPPGGGEGYDPSAAELEPGLPALEGLRLLLVEDHDDSRELLEQILESAGVEVEAVPSSREALRALEQRPPDILVSDIGMPGEDGYTLLRKLRSRERRAGDPRLPAIAVTAHAAREHRLRALRAGFQAFVAKPVDPAEILAVLASLTGRS